MLYIKIIIQTQEISNNNKLQKLIIVLDTKCFFG